MPRGVKKTEHQRELEKATHRRVAARRAFHMALARLETATFDEATARFRAAIAERFPK